MDWRIENIIKKSVGKYFFLNRNGEWVFKFPPLYKGIIVLDLYEIEGERLIEKLETLYNEDINYVDKKNIDDILKSLKKLRK